jgi:hypothetical protein
MRKKQFEQGFHFTKNCFQAVSIANISPKNVLTNTAKIAGHIFIIKTAKIAGPQSFRLKRSEMLAAESADLQNEHQ